MKKELSNAENNHKRIEDQLIKVCEIEHITIESLEVLLIKSEKEYNKILESL